MTELHPLFAELVRFQIELWNAVDARLRADHGLPLARYEPMAIIDRRKGCRVLDIAQDLVITVGGASKIVDRVEAAGHCVRTFNPDDRRSSIVELTAVGRRVLRQAATTVENELQLRIGSTVSPRALEQFGATLTALRSGAGQAAAIGTPPTRSTRSGGTST